MVAAFLDQCPRDRIGRAVAIWRGPEPNAFAVDLLTDLGRKALPHQLFSEVGCRRDQDQAGNGGVVRTPRDLARQHQRPPAAHRRTDHHLGTATKLLEPRDAFLEPAADSSINEFSAGFAVAGIIEANAGTAMFGGPRIEAERLG